MTVDLEEPEIQINNIHQSPGSSQSYIAMSSNENILGICDNKGKNVSFLHFFLV
jgi:hypothetical protein